MQDRYDTINLEYVETRKSSRLAKLTATTLSVVFTFTPISEFITTLNNEFYICTYGIVGNCGCIIGF